MVCAFVTNQLLHEQTSSSSSSSDADGDTEAGLVTSLVDALYVVDSYQHSTSQVSCLSVFVCVCLCMSLCCCLFTWIVDIHSGMVKVSLDRVQTIDRAWLNDNSYVIHDSAKLVKC